MIRPTRSLLAGLAIFGLAALGACSDDEDNAAPDPSDTTEAADTSAPAGGGEPADCEATPGKTVTVEIPEFEFAPDPVQVDACDEIVWSNTHDQAHTSTSPGDLGWSTDNIAVGEQSEPILFDTPGELTYMCALHPFMTGTVDVS